MSAVHTANARRLWSPFFVSLWILVFLVEFLKGSLLVSILPIYMGDSLGLSAGVIGIAFSLQYLGDNLFRAPAGWIAERIGYRGTMIAAFIVTLLSVLMLAFFTSPLMLVLACLLLGMGTSPLWPCAMTGTTEISGPTNSNGRAMGTLEIALLSGTGLGPIIMNYIASHSGHEYGVVFMVLTGSVILALLVSMLLPGRKPVLTVSGSDGGGRVDQLMDSIRETLDFVRHHLHVNRLIYPALFLQSFVIGVLSPVLTLYARTDLGLSPNMYSVLLVAGGAVTAITLIPCGRLVDRFGPRVFLHIGFMLAGLTLLVFFQVKALPHIFIAVGVIGFSYALILPAWNAFIASLIPKSERGTIWGFFLTLQGSGLVVGPIISGLMWDRAGHASPFLLAGAGMLLLFCCHFALARNPLRKPRRSDPS
ncbi:MFS transporter [Paenibacillus sp. FSL K6-1230]|uniref:MFS transporter n=1 Tax=Paenibacillus sp. FSL K6-1230 TaxID=2921603 RepID=UPI00039E7BE7